MSPAAAASGPVGGRIVVGAARVMDTGGTRGRTLFPSPTFSHWPPFEMLVDVSTVAGSEPDPHPHADEEVVNYVLAGTLAVYDEERRATEIPTGSVNVLTTVRAQSHDVLPKPGTAARWLSLILRLPRGASDPPHPYQNVPTAPLADLPRGLEGRAVVGSPGSARSLLGLELRDVRFVEARSWSMPVAPGRSALVYSLEGSSRVAGRDLPAGSGLLADGVPSLELEGASAARLLVATVRRDP